MQLPARSRAWKIKFATRWNRTRVCFTSLGVRRGANYDHDNQHTSFSVPGQAAAATAGALSEARGRGRSRPAARSALRLGGSGRNTARRDEPHPGRTAKVTAVRVMSLLSAQAGDNVLNSPARAAQLGPVAPPLAGPGCNLTHSS
jgi:hypothetical protein